MDGILRPIGAQADFFRAAIDAGMATPYQYSFPPTRECRNVLRQIMEKFDGICLSSRMQAIRRKGSCLSHGKRRSFLHGNRESSLQ
jgi:hypothetical protein